MKLSNLEETSQYRPIYKRCENLYHTRPSPYLSIGFSSTGNSTDADYGNLKIQINLWYFLISRLKHWQEYEITFWSMKLWMEFCVRLQTFPLVRRYMSDMTSVEIGCSGFPLRPPVSSQFREMSSLGRDTVVLDMIRPSTRHLEK